MASTHQPRVHRVAHGEQPLVGQHSQAHRAVELARLIAAPTEARTHPEHIAQRRACACACASGLEDEHAVVVAVGQKQAARMLAQALRARQP